jgi:hypothetical protein
VTTPPDDRPPQVIAAQWTSHITTVSFEMILPGLAGLWVDGKLGTVCVFTLLGFGLGMTVGLMHLLRLTSNDAALSKSHSQDASDSSDDDDSRTTPP